jgi:hypothetical protein
MDDYLKEWDNIKREIKDLKEKEEKIKQRLNKILDDKKVPSFKTKNYRVKRMIINKGTLPKKSCPTDVWDKYHKTTTFTVLKLEKINDDVDVELSD